MMYYIKQLKNWKNVSEWNRKGILAALMRNALLMILGVILYLLLNNTGLLIYIILMLKIHWAMGSK